MRMLAVILVVLVFWGGAAAAEEEKRVALVIGNSSYEHATPLPNPRNDAEEISRKLKKLGFDVVEGFDLDWQGFGKTLRTFETKVKEADVALLFYAGHGLQVDGQNYLVPVDAQLEGETDLQFSVVELSKILPKMNRARVKLVMLDACRDNPLARSLYRNLEATRALEGSQIPRGLAHVRSAAGTLIAFATEPGDIALDGSGRHSPFSEALLSEIETPGLDVEVLMRRVRNKVREITKLRQTPWSHSSLTDEFFFQKLPNAEEVVVAKLADEAKTLDAEPVANPEASVIEALEGGESAASGFPPAPASGSSQAPKEAEVKVAAVAAYAPLDPSPAPPVADPAMVEAEARDLRRQVQENLKRVGCFAGDPDGVWGRKSAGALDAFNRYANLSLPDDVEGSHLTALLNARDRVCPLICGAGTVERGGACVAVPSERDDAPALDAPRHTPPVEAVRPGRKKPVKKYVEPDRPAQFRHKKAKRPGQPQRQKANVRVRQRPKAIAQPRRRAARPQRAAQSFGRSRGSIPGMSGGFGAGGFSP